MINWDAVFERYTESGVLKATYCQIARELGVTETAVRKQFKRRGVVDPRKVRNKKTIRTDLYPSKNTNALKHGLFAEVFWTEKGKEIYRQLVESGEFPDPIDEIYLLRAKIASGELSEIDDILRALEVMSRLYEKAIMRERYELERERLECERERIRIAREKLELMKSNGVDQKPIEIVIRKVSALRGEDDASESPFEVTEITP